MEPWKQKIDESTEAISKNKNEDAIDEATTKNSDLMRGEKRKEQEERKRKENEIEVATYITPIRNDIKIPYKISEYKIFKKEIEDIAKNYKTYFTSLENLVPSEFWGTKASTSLKEEDEVDFMHFQAEGHRLLAEAIFLSISKILQLTKKP